MTAVSSWQRAVTALRTSGPGLLVMALVVGTGAAGFAVLFRWLIQTFTLLFTGHADYAATPGAANPHLPGLGRWFVVLVPVVAGLLYGPLVHFFAREARGHGVPEVMYAVAHRGGRIAPQVAGVKALASALCIGGGGSVGREGPIVQIGSALGSTAGRIVKVPESRMRVLVACGAAAGISATFNAPLAGGAGVLFTRVLYAIEDLCDSIWRGPEWLRPAVGGVALGLVLLLLPEMYGVGYPVLGNAILGGYAVGFLVVLLLGKMIATSLTIGIGGSGGVFAPSLFIGAMLGAAFGETAHVLFPAVAGPVGVYGLIGMGAVFAGAARAPITGVIILFELTGEYTIILPLMLAIVLATGLSHRLSPDTIYTLKLRRRGVDLGLPAETVGGHPVRRVGDVMTAVPTPVLSTATLVEVAAALSATSFGVLPVVDPDGTHLGVVSARGVSDALADGRHDAAAATLVTEIPTTVAVDDPLSSLAESLSRNGIDAAPVVDDEGAVVGWVDYRALLRAGSGRPATVSATT